jgi:DNA-binding MurR/RpiR family transcriptional regulator
MEIQLSSPILRFQQGAIRSDDLRTAWLSQATKNLETVTRIPYGDLVAASEMIANATGTIYILGLGKGLTVARYLWFAVNLLRPHARLTEGSELEIVDQLLDLQADDLTVVCDFRRYPRAGSSLARLIGETQPEVIAITDSATSRFAMLANYALVVSLESIFPTDDYLAAFGVAELLSGMMVANISGDAVTRRLERYEAMTTAGGLFLKVEDELRAER